MLIDGVFAGLEEALYECFVDDRHRRRLLVVGRGEGPAAYHADAEVLQIVRADAVPRRARFLAHLRCRMSGNDNQLTPVVGERVVEREAGSADPGQPVEPLLELSVHSRRAAAVCKWQAGG